MQIAICDDNLSDIEVIKKYCEEYNTDYSVHTYSSSIELLNACDDIPFDIIFLDIEMESPNGYEAAKQLKEQGMDCTIIFTTNSLDFAIRGYGVAFRYLPKPISYQMFCDAISDAESVIVPTKLEIQCNKDKKIISMNDLIYFESYAHTILFHLTSEDNIESHGNLTSYLNLLPSNQFSQIHKSYCINLDYLSSMTNDSVLLKDGTSLPIGRSRKAVFLAELQKYMRRI